jgi:hypothetical protein
MDYSGPAPKDAVRRALEAAIHAPNHWTNYPWRYARRNAICGLQSPEDVCVCARGSPGISASSAPRPPSPSASSTLPRLLDRSLCSLTYSMLGAPYHGYHAMRPRLPSRHLPSLSPAKAVV